MLDRRFPTLEELIPDIASSTSSAGLKLPLLRKLTLPVDQAGALLKLLWRQKITRAHLMPTYDSVADSLLLKSTWWRDTDLVTGKEISADRLALLCQVTSGVACLLAFSTWLVSRR